MKKLLPIFLHLLIPALFFVLPYWAGAQMFCATCTNQAGTESRICDGGGFDGCQNALRQLGTTCVEVTSQCRPTETYLENPLQSTNTIWEFFDKLMDVLVMLAIPVIVIFVILAGFKFVTAGGNQEKLTGAKKTLAYVVIGTLIILSAKVLTTVLSATVEGIRG